MKYNNHNRYRPDHSKNDFYRRANVSFYLRIFPAFVLNNKVMLQEHLRSPYGQCDTLDQVITFRGHY